MSKTDIPSPLYAAAGAGELAYEKLRKLPELASRTAEELRQRLATRDRNLNAELARVRESAQRGTAVVVARAATAQERAVTGYRNLVARGEKVVGSRIGATTGRAEPAKIEVEVGPVQGGKRASARKSTAPVG